MHRFTIAAVGLAGVAAGGGALFAATPAIPAAITKALAAPGRADAATDDERRKAAAVLAFSGVKPGDTVVDYIPGGKYYWTRIFSGIVGPKGMVYAVWPPTMAKQVSASAEKVAGWHLANVTVAAPEGDPVPKPGAIDLFWTVENYHDVVNNAPDAADKVNAAVYKALKPGGTYVVIDHADAPGSGLAGTNTTHRIDPAVVKAQVLKAGFTFAGESDALHNPADDHKLKVFDPAIRGHTDQFVYKFRKPR